jgi:hypothetical protein
VSCHVCSLPEELCICTATRPAVSLPTAVVPTPGEEAERAAKNFKEALDLEHFRRFAGLNEGERKGDFLALAQQLSGQGASVLKSIQKDDKMGAMKNMMLVAVSIKKIALAYAMQESLVDAAEKLADELDKASKPE